MYARLLTIDILPITCQIIALQSRTRQIQNAEEYQYIWEEKARIEKPIETSGENNTCSFILQKHFSGQNVSQA